MTIQEFLTSFPNNASSWSQATDEIRDLCFKIRSVYNEMALDLVEGDEGYIERLDFRSFKTPSQWNTEGKAFILKYWALLPSNERTSISNYFGWFKA